MQNYNEKLEVVVQNQLRFYDDCVTLIVKQTMVSLNFCKMHPKLLPPQINMLSLHHQ